MVSPWVDIVWNLLSIPKCSFILWLALKDRLLTRDRMLNFHMNTPASCLLCNGVETIHHLFSDCPYFDLVRRACPVNFSDDWSQCQMGNCFSPILNTKLKYIGSLYLAIAVYLTWKERNFRVHNPGQSHATISIIEKLKCTAREKLFSCSRFKKWVQDVPSLVLLMY